MAGPAATANLHINEIDVLIYMYSRNEIFTEYLILQDLGHLQRFSDFSYSLINLFILELLDRISCSPGCLQTY